MKLGIREKDFWEMELSEIERELEAISFRNKQRKKEESLLTYTLATLILSGLGGKFPTLEEAFPYTFDNEETENAKAQLQVNEFIDFANAMIEKEKENG